MPTRKQFDWIVSELETVKRQVAAGNSTPQLAHSSFDSGPGHSIDETDPETGNEVASFGTAFDGSHGLALYTGPIPGKPSPAVFSNEAAAIISGGWDGFFVNDLNEVDETIAPYMDFSHVEVHASTDDLFEAETAETIIGLLPSSRGGYVSKAVPPGTYYLRLVCRSMAGKKGPASDPVEVVVGSTVDLGPLEEALEDAEDAIAEAAGKFTVSTTVPAGSGAVVGAVWWQKDATGIIGQWVWDGTTWEPKGLAVTQLIPGGTMSSGLIDQLFADVVVAGTAVADAFIGGDAILTGAVTATHITASESLSAKVAEFLEINAGMINVGSLWADSAWIAAASTHILTVLSNTDGEGYTSTVTGQGLKVTRTIGGQTFDVIRLGTFGSDFLGISDGEGHAVATITGKGEMSATSHYVEGDIFSGGRLVGQDELPQGEVTYANYSPSPIWQTNAWGFDLSGATAANCGLIDLSFTAKKGRAYRIEGSWKYFISVGVPERPSLTIVYKTTAGNISRTSYNGHVTPTPNGFEYPEETRLSTGTVMPFTGRFVPLPFSATGPDEVECKLLVCIRRFILSGTVNVENIQLSVIDMGSNGIYGTHFGVNNGGGTTTLPAISKVTGKYRGGATGGGYVGGAIPIRQRRAVGTSGNWLRVGVGTPDDGLGDVIYVGLSADEAWEYRTSVPLPVIFLNAIRNSNVLFVDSIRLRISPTYFANGMGGMKIGVVNQAAGTVSSFATSTAPFTPENAEFYPQHTLELGAWPQGRERVIELPRNMIELIRSSPDKAITFGFNHTNSADYSDPHYTYFSGANMGGFTWEVSYRTKV